MIKPYRGTDGKQFAHNFKNTFLSESELQKPSKEVSEQVATHTRKQLEQLVFDKQCATRGSLRDSDGVNQQYIKYTPKSVDESSGAQERIIKVQSIQLDPLEPARFKHKRIPKGPGSPPPIMMRSPPRKLTLKDQLDWKIPPCISNWKNAKGYTIPLEMRLSADGRTLQHHTVNNKFAQLTDGLYIAERQSRKELEERNRILKSMAYKEHQEKEEDLRRKAQDARAQKYTYAIQTRNILLEQSTKIEQTSEREVQENQVRDELRYMRKREMEREMRMENMKSKKTRQNRDQERDVGEKIALGQAQATTKNVLYDQRLFNKTQGVDHGMNDEDEYDAFDKPLFNDRSKASIYHNVKADEEDEGQQKYLCDYIVRKQEQGRSRPVEFEKSNDIFGMDSFINDPVKKVKKD